jgi:Xaa-Pro aminopeptidase
VSAHDINMRFRTPELEINFPLFEFAERLGRLRQAMQVSEVDLVYLTSPIGRHYISGFNSDWYQIESPEVWPALGGLAVHVDHDRIISFERPANEVLLRMTTVGNDFRLYEGQDGRDFASFIVDELAAEGWLGRTAALELGSHRPNSRTALHLRSTLEKRGCNVSDCTELIRDLTIVKSPQEIAFVRHAARIGDIMMSAAAKVMRPGISELDVYAEMVAAGARAGGEHSAKAPSVASGPRTLCTDAQTTRRKLMPGDIVNIDICGCYNRYHTNFARTFSLGTPHGDVATRIEQSSGMFTVVRQTIEPGMASAELGRVIKSYFNEMGIWDERWWVGGYDVGLAFAPDWVGPYVWDPEIASARNFVPGTVVNCESDFFLPRTAGLSLLIDTMIFTEEGAELAHSIEPRLIVVD